MSSMVMTLATIAKAGVNFLRLILITSTPIVFAMLAIETGPLLWEVLRTMSGPGEDKCLMHDEQGAGCS